MCNIAALFLKRITRIYINALNKDSAFNTYNLFFHVY